jgi:hypothetical protein
MGALRRPAPPGLDGGGDAFAGDLGGEAPAAEGLAGSAGVVAGVQVAGPLLRQHAAGLVRGGDRYLAQVLGEAAIGAARTDSFLGERYRRIARRRGKNKANVAVGRSLLVIFWHLLPDPQARYHDLGPGFYDTHISNSRTMRTHIRQLQALGYKVTLEPAA